MGKFNSNETSLISQRPTSLVRSALRNMLGGSLDMRALALHLAYRSSSTCHLRPTASAPAANLTSAWPTAFAACLHILRVFAAPGRSNTNPSPCSRDHAAIPHCLCPTFHSFDRRATESHATSDRTRRRPWGLRSCLRLSNTHRSQAHTHSLDMVACEIRTCRLFSRKQHPFNEARPGAGRVMMLAG
jgi:hypothetical protein